MSAFIHGISDGFSKGGRLTVTHDDDHELLQLRIEAYGKAFRSDITIKVKRTDFVWLGEEMIRQGLLQ